MSWTVLFNINSFLIIKNVLAYGIESKSIFILCKIECSNEAMNDRKGFSRENYKESESQGTIENTLEFYILEQGK